MEAIRFFVCVCLAALLGWIVTVCAEEAINAEDILPLPILHEPAPLSPAPTPAPVASRLATSESTPPTPTVYETPPPSIGDILASTGGSQTVSDAVFSSSWQDSAWLGSFSDHSMEAGLTSSGADVTDPTSVGRPATGFFIGPTETHFGLRTGWEASTRTANKQRSESGNNSSFFIEPTVKFGINHRTSAMDIALSYEGGYRYYFNRNYTASGTSSTGDVFYNKFNLLLRHTGVRHQLTLKGLYNSGPGYDVESGYNLYRMNLNGQVEFSYILTRDIGIEAKIKGTSSVYSDSLVALNFSNTNNSSYDGQVGLVWYASGRTKVRWRVGAGETSNNNLGRAISDSITSVTNEGTKRQFVESLISAEYDFSDKLKFSAGVGPGFVKTKNAKDAKYDGFQLRYEFNASYLPSEKTTATLSVSQLGGNIRPSIRASLGWQPRPNTNIALSAYQTESYSITQDSTAQVSQGIVLTAGQQFFTRFNLSISTGWQRTDNQSLSGTSSSNNKNGYIFGTATLGCKLSEWLSWDTRFHGSGSNSNSEANDSNVPDLRFSSCINFHF